MEYQKMINFLDNAKNQLFKFRTKNQVKITDYACGTYNSNGQIKFKTAVLRSILCGCRDA